MTDKRVEIPDVDLLLWRVSVKGDEEAFRQLFETYYPALCVYAKRYISELAVREDIVQDVFIAIWENRGHIEIRSSARNYLLTSVRNRCLNALEREHTEVRDFSAPCEIPLYAASNDDLFLLSELETLLEQALAKLPDAYRKAFEMSRFEGKSYGEIAEQMGVSTRTVERYRDKAIELLRQELRDYLPLFLLVL